jgi:archaeal flagellar protein FlaJ
MFRRLSVLYPTPLRRSFKRTLRFCDIDINFEQFIGTAVMLALVISLIVCMALRAFFTMSLTMTLFSYIGVFFLVQLAIYLWLLLRADAKGRFIEDVMPDALLLMSMNIKSGMTTDRALIMAARPEFGPLEKALSSAGKEVLGGCEISEALLHLTKSIKSKLFERTIRLVIEGINSGGELSSLLQQTAEDIQTSKLVQKEVRSNLLMYAIFIFFAVGFGAPLLFAISTYLVGSVGTQMSMFSTGSSVGAMGSTGSSGLMSAGSGSATKAMQVTPAFLMQFAILALMITSVFGGLIIGIIKGGSERAGIKIIPMLMAIALTVFFVVRLFVGSMFPAIG